MKEQYYGETFARAIMFTDNIDKFLKKFEQTIIKLDVNFADVLEVINETFLAYASSGFVSDKAKSNVYFFLHSLTRMNLGKEVYQIYNMYYQELLDMLNGETKDSKMLDFYRMELFVRKSKKPYLSSTKVSDAKIKDKIQDVNKSITFDSDVLFGHLDATDDEFSKHAIHYVTSPYYVESARYLVYEYPGLLSEGNVKNRMCSTLEQRDSLNKQYRKSMFRRFALDKTERHMSSLSYAQDNKKLYKQVVGQ